ncbi:hypothetical protein JKP88DRAFT_255553 [Tribonema minus]|uniref:Uncharacterized protein n=1 Tax=Tribonema minus TaxID=303371 RepID=A0A835Z0L8_9STRA|nr:hypothetical protein JKP88DRAFT_255553 [Tribonema minus]
MGLLLETVSLLLLSTSSFSLKADSNSEVQHDGAALRFNQLATMGDWYKTTSKGVRLILEKGDVNGSSQCSGKFVEMSLHITRDTYDSNMSDETGSYSSVYFDYSKGSWRDCTDSEVTTSSYFTSINCCSDRDSLSGSADIPEVGTFKLGLGKQQLITSTTSVKIPLFAGSSTSSGETPAATAVVKFNIDCDNLINRHVTLAGDACTRGECYSTTGQQDNYWCTTKLGDATVTGTVELQGFSQPKLDLAKLPSGYTMVARADLFIDNGKVFV